MNKILCIKCGLKFKNRKDPHDTGYTKDCCWNCRLIITCITATIHSLNAFQTIGNKSLNREIMLNLDYIRIRKIKNAKK